MRKYIVILFIVFISCKENKVETSNTFEIINEAIIEKAQEKPTFNSEFFKLPLKKLPLSESTSFDSFIEEEDIKNINPEVFSLPLVYKKWYEKEYNFKAISGYRVNFSKDFHSAILTVKKGDHEMETTLINYNLEGKIIDFKLIAYDEIAEGISQKTTTLEKNFVTIIDKTDLEETVIQISKFHINASGEFNIVKDVFTSSIRPNEAILLNKIYTDTIQFQSYNDDGDYNLLFGTKDFQDVILTYNYNWEVEDKYNFKADDLIEITWKMDSIWHAGDSETLDFKETIIDARNIR